MYLYTISPKKSLYGSRIWYNIAFKIKNLNRYGLNDVRKTLHRANYGYFEKTVMRKHPIINKILNSQTPARVFNCSSVFNYPSYSRQVFKT